MTAPAPGDVVGDRFELVAHVGSGGAGHVWRARDRESGGDVALKLLHEPHATRDARFRREAAILAGLAHPRLVAHVADGIDPVHGPWLAMEWLDGCSLDARLRDRVTTLDEVLVVARGIAEGLEALHGAGIVHRDVKPSNVFLVDGRADGVRLLDLGLARRDGSLTRTLTATGAVLGTLQYAAPEQCAAARQVDARADVYALGCVLYRCIAGRPPHDARRPADVLARILAADPPRLSALVPSVPAALDALVARMMARDPDRRPADGAAVLRELGRVTGGGAADAHVLGARERVPMVAVAVFAHGAEEAPERLHAFLDRARAAGADARAVADEFLVAGFGDPVAGARAAVTFADAVVASDASAAAAVCVGLGVAQRGEPSGDVVERAITMALDATPGDVVQDAESAVCAGRTPPLPFGGRDRELQLARGMLEGVRDARRSALMLVAGPPGSGKSRLLAELRGALGDDAWLIDDDTAAPADVRARLEQAPRLAVVATRDPAPWRSAADHEVRLPPLGRQALADIARRALGPSASDEDVERHAARALGSPACLAATLAVGLDAMPALVVREACATIARLRDETRRALRLAAALGDRVDAELVGAAAGADVEQALADGTRAGVLAGGPDGRRFASEFVREALAATLTAIDRIGACARAAERLEERDGDPARIAALWSQAAQPARALPWLRRAATAALDAGRTDEALAHVEAGLGCDPPPPARAVLLLLSARAHLAAGDRDRARAHAERAREAAPPHTPLAAEIDAFLAAE